MTEPNGIICPFLGLKEDRKTIVGFASAGNFCYNCKNPTVPSMEHQTQYCLNQAHTECLVYSQNEKLDFPVKLRAKLRMEPGQNADFLRNGAMLVVLVLAVGLAAWLYKTYFRYEQPSAIAPITKEVGSPTPIPTPTVLPNILQPFVMATLDLPTVVPTSTNTPSPTSTPVLFQKHGFDIPIPVDGNTFLIHKVLPNENFDILTKNYKTSVEVTRAINFQLPNSLWANLPLVLSPGMTTVHPKLPTFEAYMVTDAAINIDDLAVQRNVDSTLTRQFNNCQNGCILRQGDWVLLPHLH